ncbi:hypothetical protein IMG5_118830 [Ichthyophthirius multifiliis]|uniref:Uncharacterized protein n=1 Tax=Ichthyophthirius multifiliis TaxID=5932 RepID=G0QUR2_ICHMU|nr:hypothetical protein IMG5_118830 [Ichthyophthirius multifiliis]EGR31047.1 hypothetical protein IMG5_118830 [Ichthyophthirius multifiliis]|eukprot:XP_004034533.1 hypothetical protein IMG5_118830 [Ichthyophthirius multifiliis]
MKLKRFFQTAAKQVLEHQQESSNNKQQKSFKEVKFPYNFRGMPDFLPIQKEHDNMIIKNSPPEIYEEFLKNLNRRMVWFMKGLQSNNDEEFPYMELNFFLKVKQSLEILKNNGYKVHFKEEDSALLSKKKEISIFETTHIIGLNSNRAYNQNVEDYDINRDLEEKGILMFTLKDFDPQELEQNDILDPKMIRDENNKLILRVHVKSYNKYIVQIEDSNGNIVSEKPETYIHTAVFENQLRNPPKFSTLKTTYLEWLKLYRIHNDWKLVDFDRFLQGNRLLYSENDQTEIYQTKG